MVGSLGITVDFYLCTHIHVSDYSTMYFYGATASAGPIDLHDCNTHLEHEWSIHRVRLSARADNIKQPS